MMHEKAFKLARAGKSNPEIFGDLEISSSALRQINGSDPKLTFAILQGRSEYIQSMLEQLHDYATGADTPVHPGQVRLLQDLIARADTNNRTLTVAHEMILLTGTTQASPTTHDPATVTSLLRSVK